MNISIRPPAVAGSFYPADKRDLLRLLESFWMKKRTSLKSIRAMIVPHAGYIYSGPTAAKAYSLLEPNYYKEVILLGPSHHFIFTGLSGDNHLKWQTPLGEIPLKYIADQPPTFSLHPEHHLPEHSLEVQLPFLQYQLKQPFKIIPLLISSEEYFNQMVSFLDNLLNQTTLLVVSSDLSHYYPYQFALEKDNFTLETILKLDLNTFFSHPNIEACGQLAIGILIKLAQLHHWKPRLIAQTTSAEASGNYTAVVGYASVIFQ